MRRLVLFLVHLALFAALGRFATLKTEGFTCLKIQDNFPNVAAHVETPPNLKQSFRYYKRGAQSFVFISEDGELVLKIFNNRLPHQLDLFRFLPFGHSKKEHFKEKQAVAEESYLLAATALKEETALVYAHLAPEATDPFAIDIIDPCGIHHTLSSKRTSFLIQKKCTLFYPTLKQKLKEGKIEDARALVTSLIQLVKGCHAKGIMNQDPSVRKNYGLCDNRAVVIDVGRFATKENLTLLDTKHTLRRFRKQLCRKHGELLVHFDKEMTQ